jgi:glycosyltransferase involved in cell wall biosynthesis
VAGWLQSASIYAFPARYEPFGLSILEAALAGCTLVLGDIPTLRELWDGAAIFVSPDHPDTLHAALKGLIGDPGLRHALSMRAHQRALTLTPRRMAGEYLELYAELLAQPKLQAPEPACAS